MTQTKLDHWLKEFFLYTHHIKVVHLPDELPRGVKIKEISSQLYNYLLIIKKKSLAEKVIDSLRNSGSVFSTNIHESNKWYSSLLNNKHKSFTFRVFWWIVFLAFTSLAVVNYKTIIDSSFVQEFRTQLHNILNP